jgi:hypothetical protein
MDDQTDVPMGSAPKRRWLTGPFRRLARYLLPRRRGRATDKTSPPPAIQGDPRKTGETAFEETWNQAIDHVPESDPRKRGVTPELRAQFFDIEEEPFWEIAQRCLPYTLVLIERLYNIYKTMEYICRNNIPGDIVECGVMHGGSVMAAAESLAHFGCTDRTIYLYDTFAGMSPPGLYDVDHAGNRMAEREPSLLYWPNMGHLQAVQRNMRQVRYPFDRFVFVEGPVEETLLKKVPETIAFLRLDTDWYESTKQELIYLYPHLVSGGVLTIDDYGHFKGARKATDEYFAGCAERMLLHRIDYTARTGVKP